jgi:hypothetical protein
MRKEEGFLVGIHASYSFWIGIPDPTKRRILKFTAQNSSIDALAVFKPPQGWFSQIEDGINPCFLDCSFSPLYMLPVLMKLFLMLQL